MTALKLRMAGALSKRIKGNNWECLLSFLSIRPSFFIYRSKREDFSWSSFYLRWVHNSKTQAAFEFRMGKIGKQKQTKQKTRNPPQNQNHFKFWFFTFQIACYHLFFSLQQAALHTLYKWEIDLNIIECAYSILTGIKVT